MNIKEQIADEDIDDTPVKWQCANCKAIVQGPKEYNSITGITEWIPGDCPSCGASDWKVKLEHQGTRMRIKQQIAALPDDGEFFVRHDLGSLGKGIQGYGNVRTVKDLKALADSHTRLLEFVSRSRSSSIAFNNEFCQHDMTTCYCGNCQAHRDASEMVEEAEKL